MQVQAPLRVVGLAAALFLGLAAMGCDDDGDATTSVRPVSEDNATAVGEAGVVTIDDLNDGERPDHIDRWSREEAGGYELFTEQAGCFVVDAGQPAEEFEQGLLAADSSDVYETADDRGPTLVSVATRTDTLVYDSQDVAKSALRRLDSAYLVSCIERTGAEQESAGSTGEGCDDCDDEFVADDDVEAREIDASEAGDEGVAFLAVYDNDSGEGDDNYSSAEIYVVRTGQVVEVVYGVRFGEDHEDDVVAEPTTGLLPIIDLLADRIAAASAGETMTAPTATEKVAADAAEQGTLNFS
jgi:hypothetical protein